MATGATPQTSRAAEPGERSSGGSGAASLLTAAGNGVRHDGNGAGPNVGTTERVLSAVGGGALAAYALRRGRAGGAATAAAGALGGLLLYRAATGRAPLYRALGITMAGGRLRAADAAVDPDSALEVERSISVLTTPEELYALWRDFGRLPRIMDYLERVTVLSDRRSHWVARAPAGMSAEWDAEIIEDRPGELIAWTSVAPAQIPNRGRVRFVPAPGDRGTEVHVYLQFEPPAGGLGNAVARAFGRSPDQEVRNALVRVKQLIEVGEIPTVEGQPSGRGS